MFKENSKNSLYGNAAIRAVFFTFLFSLAVIFLITSCDSSTDSSFHIEGAWVGFGDYYNISSTTIRHTTDESEWDGVVYPGTELVGAIEESVSFTSNSGVLIIRITSANNGFTVGKYTGVYYKDGEKASVRIANPWVNFIPVETDTLALARSLFTVDNVNTHVSMWGSYTK